MVPMLTIKEINKQFALKNRAVKQVLKGVSCTLNSGEIVGLIGESGSGKTTLARIIAGLETADSGEIIWQGKEKKKQFLVQMVFQNPYAALYKKMKVKEIIAEPLLLQKKKLKSDELTLEVNQVLNAVSLNSEHGERYPSQLSGGQRQRVALARALILQPELLIADEPTSMLDMSVQAEILDLLIKLQREWNLTILLVTHDLLLADYLCEHILVLQDGLLLEQGTRDEVMHNPKHDFTKKLVALAQKNKNIFKEKNFSSEDENNNHEG